MNILFSIPPIDGWVRAANYLGYKGFILDENKIFDSFTRAKPDIVIVFDDNNSAFQKCLTKFNPKLIKIDSYLPAADSPPTFNGGEIIKHYQVDAIIIGDYKKEYSKYLKELCNSDVNFKIFGSGDWKVPQYLGYIPPIEIKEAYASAKWSLDLEAEPNRVLAINAAGGNALSAGKWNIGVPHLDNCKHFTNEVDLIKQIKSSPCKFDTKTPTLADRLKEILEINHVNMDSINSKM